ncbi:MAG TPA: glycosyltransferase family 39 protein [Pyrinomonadaceae bacterium]
MTPSAKTITITPTVENQTAPPPLPTVLAAWRWWLAPALVALAFAVLFADPFIGDWDALDYTINAVNGTPSTMALGRILFIFFNHALWLISHKIFHLQAEQAYLLFKYAVAAQGFLAVVACWTLARDLTGSLHTATVAALLVAVSPVFVMYSGQVMTDVPSVLIVAVALTVHLRGLRRGRVWLVLLGAALLGAGANVRETATFYAPWLVIAPFVCGWKLRAREIGWTIAACVVFVTTALAPFAVWYAMDLNGYRTSWQVWRETMNAEVTRHPVELRNLYQFLLFFFALSPLTVVALPAAIWREWREHKLSPLLLTALMGLFANLLLFFNYSTVINWRYFLTGLPALVPIVASFFMRSQLKMMSNVRRAFWSVVAGIMFMTLLCGFYLKPVSSDYIRKRVEHKKYLERLKLLPTDAVVIAGGETIAVNYWQGIGVGRWQTIGTGSGWPGEQLIPAIEKYLNSGSRVFLDKDSRWWSPCGWQKEETIALVSIERHFHFRRVSDTIYEIRPLADETAHDAPHLESLLPENRPDDTRICQGIGKSP